MIFIQKNIYTNGNNFSIFSNLRSTFYTTLPSDTLFIPFFTNCTDHHVLVYFSSPSHRTHYFHSFKRNGRNPLESRASGANGMANGISFVWFLSYLVVFFSCSFSFFLSSDRSVVLLAYQYLLSSLRCLVTCLLSSSLAIASLFQFPLSSTTTTRREPSQRQQHAPEVWGEWSRADQSTQQTVNKGYEWTALSSKKCVCRVSKPHLHFFSAQAHVSQKREGRHGTARHRKSGVPPSPAKLMDMRYLIIFVFCFSSYAVFLCTYLFDTGLKKYSQKRG